MVSRDVWKLLAHTNTTDVDGVVGIQTRFRMMVGADDTTELWQSGYFYFSIWSHCGNSSTLRWSWCRWDPKSWSARDRFLVLFTTSRLNWSCVCVARTTNRSVWRGLWVSRLRRGSNQINQQNGVECLQSFFVSHAVPKYKRSHSRVFTASLANP